VDESDWQFDGMIKIAGSAANKKPPRRYRGLGGAVAGLKSLKWCEYGSITG
jgi:hypothetical protein